MSTPPSDAPPVPSSAPTWILLLLVLAAIGAVGYYAFYDTGRRGDERAAPGAVSLTSPVPVATATPMATPAPSPSASPER